jgi:hypothetical protein
MDLIEQWSVCLLKDLTEHEVQALVIKSSRVGGIVQRLADRAGWQHTSIIGVTRFDKLKSSLRLCHDAGPAERDRPNWEQNKQQTMITTTSRFAHGV